jgi:hypothetical protein
MPGEIVPIVLFISIAAVAILRPLTKRIGLVIERAYGERRTAPDPQIARIMELMERLVDRLDRLEDRVEFTERMLERQATRPQLGEAAPRPGSATRRASRASGDPSSSP